MKIFVGNLTFDTTKEDLQKLFESHGQVTSVDVVEDQYTGKPRGFAFVQMASSEEANAAISALNEQNMNGRPLTVNEARPKTAGGGGGGRNFGGGGSGGGGGRGGYGGGGGGRGNYGGGGGGRSNSGPRSGGNRYR